MAIEGKLIALAIIGEIGTVLNIITRKPEFLAKQAKSWILATFKSRIVIKNGRLAKSWEVVKIVTSIKSWKSSKLRNSAKKWKSNDLWKYPKLRKLAIK